VFCCATDGCVVIGKVLVFLRKRLNDYLRDEIEGGSDEPTSDKVVFIEGNQLDPITFHDAAVSALLVNVDEERVMRAADPYIRKADNGKPERKQPDIKLVLYLLFVARFKQYDLAWDHLAKVIEYLQTNKTFERDTHADLPVGVDRLTLELVTQTFSEQNDVWNALRMTYHPSVLYRVRLVMLRDVKPAGRDQITEPAVIDLHGIS
jgi:hypothetical protein